MIYMQKADNGFIVKFDELEGSHTYVYKSTHEGVMEMLQDVVDDIGYRGTRYDEKRVVVRLEPGDKYEGS